jgi:hypothetical protein
MGFNKIDNFYCLVQNGSHFGGHTAYEIFYKRCDFLDMCENVLGKSYTNH